jgi:hypothetical protein
MRDSDEHSNPASSDADNGFGEYDRDLLKLLPNLPIIDDLVAYYFEYAPTPFYPSSHSLTS